MPEDRAEFAKLADEYTDVVFIKVDVDENEDTAQEYGISAMPTFKFVKEGKTVAEVVGGNLEGLKAAIVKNK